MNHVNLIQNNVDLADAFEIRRIVFVLEQQCDPAEEYDEHEPICKHFLCKHNGVNAGTCRYRKTDFGYKLERYAVLMPYRGKGVGAALLLNAIEAVKMEDSGAGSAVPIYLHAQEYAIPFYEKYGFVKQGDRFYEANIPHFKMVLSH